MPDGELLISGATGFVGMELLARYLDRGERRIVVLLRAQDDAAARQRVDGVLSELFGDDATRHAGRVEAVAADLTKPGLGLTRRRSEQIAARVDQVIHCAASVSFSRPLNQSRRVNVAGTRRVLALAELARAHGGLERYVHVSTAYVVGARPGCFHERELDVGQCFRNPYEQSKFEAEMLVREQDLPTTVVRPSIVVGDRRSGWTAAFNVLYWPLRAFARGLLEAVPAIPSAPVDVVSIDYVADAICALSTDPGTLDQTFHLTAGAHASSVGELTELASRYFDRPPPRLVAPEEFASLAGQITGLQRNALEQTKAYLPYFAIDTVFDNARALEQLEPAGIRTSPLAEYLERLLDFATRTHWGKRPLSRVQALAACPR